MWCVSRRGRRKEDPTTGTKAAVVAGVGGRDEMDAE